AFGFEGDEGHGGAHALEAGLPGHFLPDRPVAGRDPIGRRQVGRRGGVDGEPRRDLTGDVAARPAGAHQGHGLGGLTGRLGVERILIVLPDHALMTGRRPDEPHLTSITVLPTWIVSPRRSPTGAVTRRPLT